MADTKKCAKCQEPRLLLDFPPRKDSSDGRGSWCKFCRRQQWQHKSQQYNAQKRRQYASSAELRLRIAKYARQWQQSHKDEQNNKVRVNRLKRRQDVITKYGGKCHCCGESHFEFLVMDHVMGGGSRERRQLGHIDKFYSKLLIEDVNHNAYRVLCSNCNTSYGLYGRCPHSDI